MMKQLLRGDPGMKPLPPQIQMEMQHLSDLDVIPGERFWFRRRISASPEIRILTVDPGTVLFPERNLSPLLLQMRRRNSIIQTFFVILRSTELMTAQTVL